MKYSLGFLPCGTAEPYIFISYSRKDLGSVSSVTQFLHRQGFRIWYDAGIYAGDVWRDEIAGHIENCCVFIAFLSVSSSHSKHCRAELSEAQFHSKPIIPVYLDHAPLRPGDRMYLRDYQSVKLYEYNSPEQFAEECLLHLPSLAPCRTQAKIVGDTPLPAETGSITWEISPSGTLTVEPIPSPEGEFQLLLRVRLHNQDA